jgi:hypothetical protein
MNVEVFALCDAATDYGGKLNLLGTFDSIRSRQFPAVHPHCAIAVRVRFEKNEARDHRFCIRIVDEDGKPVTPAVEGGLGVACPPSVSSVAANLVLNINGLVFAKPGRYSVDLAIDNQHERSLPLSVMPMEPGPPAGG